MGGHGRTWEDVGGRGRMWEDIFSDFFSVGGRLGHSIILSTYVLPRPPTSSHVLPPRSNIGGRTWEDVGGRGRRWEDVGGRGRNYLVPAGKIL